MKKAFAPLIILALLISLSSCRIFCGCDKSIDYNPNDYTFPDDGSLITYTLENGETIKLLYTKNEKQSNSSLSENLLYGEWYRNSGTVRVCAVLHERYSGCLIHGGRNLIGISMEIHAINGLKPNTHTFSPAKFDYDYVAGESLLAHFELGALTSTRIQLSSTEDIVISSIDVSEAPFEYWDWNSSYWSKFIKSGTLTIYYTDKFDLSYTPQENTGELKIGDTSIPIKLVPYLEAEAFAVYDISDNGSKLIMYFIGRAESEVRFVIEQVVCTSDFEYSEIFSNFSYVNLTKDQYADY